MSHKWNRRENILPMLKHVLKRSFHLFNLEVSRREPIAPLQPPRASMEECLSLAVKNGLNIRSVFDVGAASGTWPLYRAFPSARHLLVEPLEEFYPTLEHVVTQLSQAELICAAATRKTGKTSIHVHPDLVGSSFYKEDEDSNVNGVERTIQGITLDDICVEKGARSPYLIKVDTQGAELDVLSGAEQILSETEMVILEVSFFKFFNGGPQFYDCIQFMHDRGFVVYDIFDLQYRLLDNAMSQVDIAFVKENSLLRKYHYYATAEQRQEQNRSLLEKSIYKS